MTKKAAGQIIHKRCGGGIVLIESAHGISLACNKCVTEWVWPGGVIVKHRNWRALKPSEGVTVDRTK